MSYSRDALRTRLDALECPFLDSLNLDNPLDQQKLICWLEDAHIRRTPISERASLRQTSFLQPLQTYLKQLDAPFSAPQNLDSLEPAIAWLVDLALSLHYNDDNCLYNEPIDPWKGRCVPIVPSVTECSQVRSAVETLLQTMRISPSPEDINDGLRVAANFAEASCNSLVPDQSTDRMDVDGEPARDDAQKLNLDTLPLGFSTGDPVVDRTGKIMRLFYVNELRNLQNCVNDAIAELQTITSNPKTDSKLGKVGR